MMPTTVTEIAAACDGRWSGPAGSDQTPVTGVGCVDSRLVQPGDVFFAVQGEHADGHDFITDAAARGAVAAVVQRIPAADGGLALVLVDDVSQALRAIAADQARRLTPHCRIIGITGSSGKTTTKDLLASVLETVGPTVSPPGSFNNEIGMPLTILQANESTRFLVLEMGARGPGHIAQLCAIAAPSIGLVLNVGSAHVGEFGDIDTIARTKSELAASLPSTGTAVLNADDPRTAAMVQVTEARVLTFGRSPEADVRARDVERQASGTYRFVMEHDGVAATVDLGLLGEYNVSNALAVGAAAVAVGVPLEQAATALSQARSRSRWRMEVTTTEGGATLVNDAYNANPEAVEAALQAVAAMPREGRLWIVLGEMLELGAAAEAEHRAAGQRASAIGADRFIAVGNDQVAGWLAEGATQAGLSVSAISRTADAHGAAGILAAELAAGDLVLIKASRSVGLERIAMSLAPPPESGASA